MKEASVLHVLIYLFKNHIDGSLETGNHIDNAPLIEQLQEAGFDRRTIFQALSWIDRLASHSKNAESMESIETASAIRLYDKTESEQIDLESRGFLTFMEQYGVLTPYTREMVITQAIALEEYVDINVIKWITLLVLFTQPDERQALKKMEFLVLESVNQEVH